MTLTQRAVYSDVHTYLGLATANIANAVLTDYLLISLQEMQTILNLTGSSWTEDTANISLQKQAEIRLAAVKFYEIYYNQRENLDKIGDNFGYSGKIDFGGVSGDFTEKNNADKLKNVLQKKRDCYNEYQNYFFKLLRQNEPNKSSFIF